jgi:hypothetical protein
MNLPALAELSNFLTDTFIGVVVVFAIVPAIIKDLFVAVNTSVRVAFVKLTCESEKLFAIF